MKQITYDGSGVNRKKHAEVIEEISKMAVVKDPRILNRIGAVAALFKADFPELQEPVLVLKAEEPGSKQFLAKQFDRIENIGFDMINHLINDIIVMGAKPLAVLDVIICGKLEKGDIIKIVSAIAKACENQDCTLVGGEISEQPEVVPDDVFILSSSVVGIVDKLEIIDGSSIKENDKVIALASNGPFTNGFALIRKLIKEKPGVIERRIGNETFIDAVLRPHLAYYPYLKEILGSHNVHGLAHITGDGIRRNLQRILPVGLSASINLSKIEVLPIFAVIKEEGNVPEYDMLSTFNMGIGMAMVIPSEVVSTMIKYLEVKGIHAYEIGAITKGRNTVDYCGKIDWGKEKL